MNVVRAAWQFLYFRLAVGSVLFHPIGAAGLATWIVRPSRLAAGVCLLAMITAYCFANERLFREASRMKADVLDFLRRHEGARLERVPSAEVAACFDISFLIPAYPRPDWLVRYFLQNRVHVFIMRSGDSGPRPPNSPRAYVSAVAQDVYIFLRDRLDQLRPEQHFRLAHELGHATAMFCAMAQRNLVGLTPVYASVAWTMVTAKWSLVLLGWSAFQLFAARQLGRTFERYRSEEHFHGEVVADYMALRHLSPESVQELVDGGLAERLVQRDPALDDAHTQQRRTILLDQFARLRRGEEIDVPSIYMDYSFVHPTGLTLFVIVHLAYLSYFASTSTPSVWLALAFLLPVLLYFGESALRDARAGRGIAMRLGDAASG